MISARFLLYIFFLVFLKRNNLYFPLKYKMSVGFFLYIYCYYKYTAKNVDDSIIFFC